MNTPRPSLRTAALCLGALIALAYGSSLGNELVFDDAIFMERDPRVQSFEAARVLLNEPLWAFQDAPGRSGVHQYYRPLQLLPLVIANEWFGGAAWICHAINLAMHFVIAVLAFVLIAVATGARRVALFGAAVFCVHPGSSEAILWVSDFAGLGVAFATLAVLLLHARVHSTIAAFVGAALLALFGMFCKESGILIAPTLLLWDLLLARYSADHAVRSKPHSARLAAYVGVAAATAIYIVLRNAALGGMLPGVSQLELTATELLLNAVALLPHYLATFTFPTDLNMYHDFNVVRSPSDPTFVYGCAIAAAWLLATSVAWRRSPAAAFGLLFAGLAVAPYLLVRWPQLNAYAERYTYLPSFGIILAGVDVVRRLRPSPLRRGTTAVLATVLIVLSVSADRQRTADWHDEVSIYEKTLEQSPRAELIRNNLALRYLGEGRPELGIPIQEALMELDPRFRSGWHNLGLLYLADDQRDRARTAFERAVEVEPLNAASWLNLGYVRDASGMRTAAIEAYFRALGADPHETKALYNLAVIAVEMGQPANAMEALARIASLGANDDAVERLRESARSGKRRDPDAATLRALREQLQRGRKAVEAGHWRRAEAALRTAAWLDQRAHLPHHFLANAYYLQGRQEAALRSEEAALARAPNSPLYRKNVASLQAVISGDASAGESFDRRSTDAQLDSQRTSSDLEDASGVGDSID